MIDKDELVKITQNDLYKVITTHMIYQYADFNVALNEIVLKQSLQFSDPKSFNDPFDCNEHLLKIVHSEKMINDSLSQYSGSLSRRERRDLKKKVLNPSNNLKIYKSEREKFKMSCFSELPDEVLMWSHYANKHNGICLGFGFPPKYDDNFILCPVKYVDSVIPIEGDSDIYRVILYWLTTKSRRWEYEKEIRAITKCNSKQRNEYIHYDIKYLKEIIFGCNVSDSKIEEAISKLKRNKLQIKDIVFKRMKINYETYLLKQEII